MKVSTRVFIFVAAFVALSVVVAYASTLTLPPGEASSISSQTQSLPSTTKGIFLNNVQIALTEFIPVYGPVFGILVSYDTGVATAALSQANPQAHLSGLELFLFLILTPIYWLEFFSYSLAVEESIAVVIWIALSVKNRSLDKTELKWLVGSILAVVIVLFFSARLESSLVGGLIPNS